ncbi:hypothetical protein AOR13_2983 [Alteromonas stellipolaris LMG 21856]|nr:hypothetical protein AOR13_2983 [Alteromonas stellipolaris LMG 21856]
MACVFITKSATNTKIGFPSVFGGHLCLTHSIYRQLALS